MLDGYMGTNYRNPKTNADMAGREHDISTESDDADDSSDDSAALNLLPCILCIESSY
jgi:hypothetical protein